MNHSMLRQETEESTDTRLDRLRRCSQKAVATALISTSAANMFPAGASESGLLPTYDSAVSNTYGSGYSEAQAQADITLAMQASNSPDAKWQFVPVGESIKTGCARAPLKSKDVLMYCPNDNTTYVGAEAAEDLLREAWYGPDIALMHEVGHYQQSQIDPNAVKMSRTEETVPILEGQADCFAGVVVSKMPELLKQEMSASSPGIVRLFSMHELEEQQAPARVHPPTAVRQALYNKGMMTGNLAACDEGTLTKVSPATVLLDNVQH